MSSASLSLAPSLFSGFLRKSWREGEREGGGGGEGRERWVIWNVNTILPHPSHNDTRTRRFLLTYLPTILATSLCRYPPTILSNHPPNLPLSLSSHHPPDLPLLLPSHHPPNLPLSLPSHHPTHLPHDGNSFRGEEAWVPYIIVDN